MESIDEEREAIRFRFFADPVFELGEDFVQGDRAEVPCCPAEAVAEGARFDVVVLDPPAFIQRRKDIKKGKVLKVHGMQVEVF